MYVKYFIIWLDILYLNGKIIFSSLTGTSPVKNHRLLNVCIIYTLLGHFGQSLLTQPANKEPTTSSISFLTLTLSPLLVFSLLIPFAVNHIYKSIHAKTKNMEAAECIKHKCGVRQNRLDPWLCYLFSAWPWGYGLTFMSSNNTYIYKIKGFNNVYFVNEN